MAGLFDAPDVDMSPGPVWDKTVDVPVSGRTPAAQHASATGAQHIAVVRGRLIRQLLAAFLSDGKLTIREAAVKVARDPNSITSTWSKLESIGWIEGLGEFRTYTHQESGREVKGEYHQLTARGREVAVENRGAR